MKLTNHFNLPAPIVAAVARDPYTKGDAHISVTGLIGPARKRALEARHADEITEDVSNRLWSLIGQIGHGILERADVDAVTEERLYIERHGWRISGQFDRYVLEQGLLQDYKFTTTYGIKEGAKPEWEAQENLYKLLLETHGYSVVRLQVVAILRDWQKGKAKHSGDYPQVPVQIIDVPVWPRERVEAYIVERLTAHGKAQHELPQCTPAERWATPDTFAVMKVGNTRATSVWLTEDEAHRAVAELIRTKPGRYSVQRRSGENKRCQDYCPAAAFCSQWEELRRVDRIDFAS